MNHPFIIDTHAHLCDPAFDTDLATVIRRADEIGVRTIISVSETLADAEKNTKLQTTFPEIQVAAGLYPAHLALDEAERLITFVRNNRKRLVAIGEVGLDYWITQRAEQKEIQQEIFKKFISLSLELNLPLNVHSRSAGKYAIKLLSEAGAQRVQMHAFDGKAGSALAAVEAGYYFSIPPSVVRSPQKQKLVRQLPLSCLLVETDSPVLGPTPTQRNEPKNIIYAIEAIAEIKGLSKEEVTRTVFENTISLYGDAIVPR